MSLGEIVLLLAAGVAAGLSGSIAGLASLFSYPALLVVGLPATAANVTNTVALTVSGLGAAAGSRTELSGQAATVRRFGPVVALGGAAGAALLLFTPSGVFEKVVPLLVAGASVVLLLQPWLRAAVGTNEGTPARSTEGRPWTVIGLFLVSLYGGYFGAAAGVLMLALFLVGLPVTLLQANALKSVLLSLANVVAAIGFTFLGPIEWAAALPLAAGVVVGGYLGPGVVRRLPVDALRVGIALAGLALAVTLAVDAY